MLLYEEFEGIVIQTLFFGITKHFVCIINKSLRKTNKILRKIYSQLAKDFPYGSAQVAGNDLDLFFQAHEMVIQAMCISLDGRYVFTGGYDRVVKRWDLATPAASGVTGEFHAETAISSMCAGEKGQIYVGGTAGYLVRVDAC